MIERYTRPAMGQIWTEENKLAKWLEVELLACEALAERGEVPRDAVARLRQRARVNVARMQEIEAQTKHDVIAFVSSVAETVGEEGRYLHLGLTSSDVIDTGFAVQLCEATNLLLTDLDALLSVLKRLAQTHKHTVMIGRTHGVHAEPITFGLKAAHWYAEMARNHTRLVQARQEIAFGKISGAVGTFANIDPEAEAFVCARLGLTPEPVSTQIVPRDRHAVFFSTLAVIGSSLERIATEVRHLQRTEVLEVEEPFTPGQKGSSAMPHKRNPWQLENVCGMARLLRGYALTAFENVPLWHERDISHSSVERVIGPDATIALDFMLARLTGILDKLVVHPERMQQNMATLGEAIYSEHLLLALVRKGIPRDEAYRWVQRNAMRVWENGASFAAEVRRDPDITRLLSPAEIDQLFDAHHALRHTDTIMQRVLNEREHVS
ncbi:MAG TPA: adenylosuccinate lyase [Candidatus Binatia bacterium]|jgi:adenylosuccinate lyase|nr:adenylosuccinate lyase [Candidatus Binatia bacterium]